MAYGIVVHMEGKQVLVVGGGKVAGRKAKKLLEEGACVHIAAPEMHASCVLLQEQWHGKLILTRDPYQEDLLKGRDLVIAATSDEHVNIQVYADCRKHHILCNNVSDYIQSDFSNMSARERFGLTFFLSSNGGAPGLTSKVLDELVDSLDERLLQGIEEYGKIRREIRHEEITEERRRLLKELMETPLSQMDKWRCFRTEGEKHDHQGGQ